ncbi:MAG: hypothetical protein KJO23_06910 [Bacteroidia bacterium]|nr:hypothetical protein [Bacteroidia bacterium]
MRLLFILTALCTQFSLTAHSQSYEGSYEVRYEMNDGSIFNYSISLKRDGSFLFHAYEYHTKAITPEKNNYGKGTWTAKKNLITFTSSTILDMDDKHTLNFTNTKARIDRKSPRNKSAEIVPDLMRIYESEISWIKGKKLTKVTP